MSRGGRGGGRGGGFGHGRGGGGVGGGPFGGDDLKPDYSVTELFPPQPPPVQAALSKEERAIVARYRSHREKIRNGPMYTVMARKRGMEDPFNDISRYSQKYKKQIRKAPKLDARPYVHGFFPEELYPTMGIEEKRNGGKKAEKIEKRLLFSALDTLNPLDDLPELGEGGSDGEGGKEEGAKKEAALGRMAGDVEEDAGDAEDEEEPDEFTDDDEGDYNAEQYFDDGGDIGDDYGDDDAGGDYY